jgi:hypothetical protein
VDRLAAVDDWDGLVHLRAACLDATEETGRQLWGPARYAAYRAALDAPAPIAASMLEPGVVRFGLGPLTEVVAQHHTFGELAPFLDATLLPVVAQERVLRGEDLRDDERAHGAPDDPPLVLQPFEPAYVLPEYRAAERLDGAVLDPSETAASSAAPAVSGWGPLPDAVHDAGAGSVAAASGAASGVPARLVRALEDVVAPWSAQSAAEITVTALRGSTDDACRALLAAASRPTAAVRGPITTAALLRMLAHAGASGGVHGRRRGGAAGRSLAWWVVRCATGLDRVDMVDPEELEFRLEDLELVALRTPGEAAWRLELAIGSGGPGGSGEEWAVAITALDHEDPAAEGPAADADPALEVHSDEAPWRAGRTDEEAEQ